MDRALRRRSCGHVGWKQRSHWFCLIINVDELESSEVANERIYYICKAHVWRSENTRGTWVSLLCGPQRPDSVCQASLAAEPPDLLYAHSCVVPSTTGASPGSASLSFFRSRGKTDLTQEGCRPQVSSLSITVTKYLRQTAYKADRFGFAH